MANLVSPGYDRSTLINSVLKPIEERTIEFKGLNRRRVVNEGEMSDMLNMTSDNYPLLTPRKARGKMRLPVGAVNPLRIMSKFDKIALIAKDSESNVRFYYDNNYIEKVNNISESTTMVAINTKICFFPEKTYLEISNEGVIGDYGSLEYEENLTGAAINISNDTCSLSVSANNKFKYDDAITIVGTLSYTSEGTTKTKECNISAAIESVDETNNRVMLPSNTFIELIGEGVQSATVTGTISRTMPDLEHVTEWNNRLWGCNSEDNTIYASKLGDPTNWQYYQGTSLDSFYAQQGTDGVWTGVGLYSSHIIFFKENSMCRIYGTAPSNYQITNTDVFGVELGSRQSVVTINDTVFYKSKIGIMAYSGGVPECISDGFNVEFKGVVAGTEKRKYYASIQAKGKGHELMVLDTSTGFWHKEDDAKFKSCATVGDSLYYITSDTDELLCSVNLACSDWLLVGAEANDGEIDIINPKTPFEDESALEWMAVFGPFDEYLEEHKIYSKLAMRIVSKDAMDNHLTNEEEERLITEEGETFVIPRGIKVYISMDEGDWELVETYEPPQTKGDFIPIVPRRCDRYSVKIEGQGKYEIKSLTRRVRKGSFGRM